MVDYYSFINIFQNNLSEYINEVLKIVILQGRDMEFYTDARAGIRTRI
jgi:hypothetical protein